MKRLTLLLILFCFQISSFDVEAQVHLCFSLCYMQPEVATPLRLTLVAPDGKADTLVNITMRSVSKSVRRNPQMEGPSVSKRYDRELASAGYYRLLLTLDTSTLEVPFSLDGTELWVDAGLYVKTIDDFYTVGFPRLDIYRPAPEEVKLYYLGVDTVQGLLFNLVNHSADTLFHGYENDFNVYVRNYVNGKQPDFYHSVYHSLDYSYHRNEPLVSGRSRRIWEKNPVVNPGRCHATLCYATDSHYYPRNHETWSFQGGFITSLWQPLSIQTWYVVSCDLFLTTLDLR